MNQNLDLISSFVPPGARVLDLGSGDGTLLQFLAQEKQVTGYGIEIDFSNIVASVKKGLSVFQGNMNEGLKEFSDSSFDVVVLSRTLQEVMEPLLVLSEMLRVGKRAIISFPNFGHWAIRLSLLLSGHSPKSKSLPYEWYNTPNIRVITLADFRRLCKEHGYRIVAEKSPNTPLIFANLFAKEGFFVLEKQNN